MAQYSFPDGSSTGQGFFESILWWIVYRYRCSLRRFPGFGEVLLLVVWCFHSACLYYDLSDFIMYMALGSFLFSSYTVSFFLMLISSGL